MMMMMNVSKHKIYYGMVCIIKNSVKCECTYTNTRIYLHYIFLAWPESSTAQL